jgi:phosphinothricin acetyltransferase
MLEIIPCPPSAYAEVAEIYNSYILQNGYTMDCELKVADNIAAWVQQFNDREMLYIAQVEEKIVGWAIIKRYSDREGYRTTAETAVYLKEDATGKGYGTTIKKFLIEKCKELEYRHLVAKIWAANKASLEYNRKLGYEIVGTQKNIGFKNGEWIDVTIMQYLIY